MGFCCIHSVCIYTCHTHSRVLLYTFSVYLPHTFQGSAVYIQCVLATHIPGFCCIHSVCTCHTHSRDSAVYIQCVYILATHISRVLLYTFSVYIYLPHTFQGFCCMYSSHTFCCIHSVYLSHTLLCQCALLYVYLYC